MEKRKSLAYSAAFKAGAYLLQTLGKVVEIKEKSHLDLFSEADKEAEKIIVSEIRLHFPKDGILSEESPEVEAKTKYRWIIDPLDGTHNFLVGLKEFGTLLALEEKGKIVFGICYFPMLREMFVAEKGKGAFCNRRRLKVSSIKELRGQMFCSDGIVRKKPKEILRDIEGFCAAGCRLRVYGSAPFAFTRVALGQAVVATNRLGVPWDIAAPALLVEESGGKVTDEKDSPWRIDSENLIATNDILHNQALALFQ